jgi:hypothetical protein
LGLALIWGRATPAVWAEETGEVEVTSPEGEMPGDSTGNETTGGEPAPDAGDVEGEPNPDHGGSDPDSGGTPADGGTDPDNGGTDQDQALKAEAWTVFYDTLTDEEQFYFLQRHDQGDFERHYVDYHKGTIAAIGQSLRELSTNEFAVRNMLFVALVHARPRSETLAELKVYLTGQYAGEYTTLIERKDNTLMIGDFDFVYRLEGNTVVGVSTGGNPEIALVGEQRFEIPPTIDRAFPNFRS